MRFATRQGKSAPVVLALVLLGAAGCGGQADEAIDSAPAAVRVDNPFAGVKGYVNPEWRAKALAESGGDRVANNPTAVWLRNIASITGASGGTSLRQHLDNALAQSAGYIEVVLYDLPGRDCTSWTLNTELQANDLSTYQSQFVDPIAAIEADSKYASLRIINIIEPKSLAYLVTNLSSSRCSNVQTSSDYVGGVQYALGKLGAIPNAYNYLDIAHHGVLGWEQNLTAAVALYVKTIQGATGGFGAVAGFVSNVANYSATVEPFFQASTMVSGTAVRQSKWVDWNVYVDEQSFAGAWKAAMIGKGMSDGIGMLIDTSRNGWGGSARPKAASTSTDVNTFVEQSRIDRRIRIDNWCNQGGAGLGERPQVVGANGIQAYVWIKPPGESDGASSPSSDGKGYEPMCNPAYEVVPDGALPSAPIANAWFSSEFQELMANAYPPLDAAPTTDTTPPSTPTGLAASNITTSALMLSWNASTDDVAVVAYDVYNGSTIVGSAKVTTTTVTGLTTGTTYSLTVRARDAAGNVSARSSPVTVTTSCPCDTTPPSVPTNLTASNLTTTSLTLSWSPSTDNVGVVGYDVYSGTTLVTSVQVTRATVPGPAAGESLTYTVRARDAAGNVSAPSPSLTATLPCCGTPSVPSVPTNLTYKNVTYSTVTLSWTASTDEYGAVNYEVWEGTKPAGQTTSTQLDVTGLLPGTTHTFAVRAVNSKGMNSDLSTPVTVTTLSITVPTPPTNLRWTASGGTVELCWDPPGMDAMFRFNLFYGSFNLGAFNDTCVALIGFKAGTPYTFTVKTVDANGNLSVASNAVTVLLGIQPDTTAPTAPTILGATMLSSTSVRLTWAASKDDVGVVLYQIYSSGSLIQTVAASTSATVTGLTSGQTYVFTVKAVDAAGNVSAASSGVTLTPITSDPTAPSNLRVTNGSDVRMAAALAWDPPTSGGAVVSYEVYRQASWGNLLVERTAVTSAVVTATGELGETVVGTFFVKAIHASGDPSPASVPIAVTFSIGGDPLQLPSPSQFRATATTSTSASLSWSPINGNSTIWYRVYSDDVLVALTTSTSATLSNLTSGKTYTFTLRATDSYAFTGSAGWTVTVKTGATLDSTPPSAPTNVRMTKLQDIGDFAPVWSATFTWSASTDNVGVVGYDLYCMGPYASAATLITSSTTTTVSTTVSSGKTVCTLRARDAVGNSSSDSTSVTISTQ